MLKKVETWLESIPRWAAALLMILLLAAYWPINQFPLFKPHYLPLIWGEQYIPFTGWTTYIYLSLFFYGLAAMYALPAERFGRTYLAIGAIEILHLVIFVLYPTTYPRPAGDTSYPLFEFLKFFDSPTNCFPSLHVAIPIFLALAIWRGGKKIGILFLFWAILLALSTLTTKQHYLLDVFGGILTALLGLLLI
ncbi:MAG: phosphatase PAP2 family protein [Patescibacteria group bacterium]